jgi:tRNA pseudouridine13 synthase
MDWQSVSAAWQYAQGKPLLSAEIKAQPDDFRVVEQCDWQLSGDGEHVWLYIEKCRENSDQVAKQLARLAGVAYRDVGYAGRKDYWAVTRQWFSVWLPRQSEPQWRDLESDKIIILERVRHDRKLRLGAHQGNRFQITLRNLSGDFDALKPRVARAVEEGVPNYFGLQRFGRNFSNMDDAQALFSATSKRRDRRQIGMLLSAARAWLFNESLSKAVSAGSWNVLEQGQAAVLDGSASYFLCEQSSDRSDELQQRLASGDIHPGLPLFGESTDPEEAQALLAPYSDVLGQYPGLVTGLAARGLKLDCRASRCLPKNLSVTSMNDSVVIEFDLPKGQFATTVLRELIMADGV